MTASPRPRPRLSSRSFLSPAGLLLASVLGASCATLPTISANECGNGVVDRGEDCDGFAPKGALCRKVDEPLSCKFDCSTSKCPSGYLCGKDDGVCRAPSGTFETNESIIEVPAARVQLGDFDGDGTHDILARTRADEAARESLRILYLDAGAQTATRIFPIHSLAISPVITQANNDGYDDLFFGSSLQGLDVFLGAKDGTLSPLAFARFGLAPGSICRMVITHGLPRTVAPFGELPLILLNTRNEKGEFNVLALASPTADPLNGIVAILPAAPDKLLGLPVGANIDESTSCEEVLVAYQGDTDVSMFSPCLTSEKIRSAKAIPPTAQPAADKILSFPGKPLTAAPVATDLNGDGHIDVIVRAGDSTFVAFGKGDGTFSSSADLTAATPIAQVDCLATSKFGTDPKTGSCFPLAIESATSKALGQHVVTTNALFRIDEMTSVGTTVGLKGTLLGEQSGGGWTVARIADFNHDGLVDVAAASSTALDIDYFTGTSTPEGFFNPTKVVTFAPVGQLGVGDYDGDRVLDLAVLELGVDGADIDGINVAYGNTAGPPDPLFRMGEFPHIRQVETGRFSGIDAIDELGLAYTPESDQVTVLDGQGDRQLLSPFGLATSIDGANIQGSPLGVALGQFDADPLPDVVALGFDLSNDPKVGLAKPRLWLAPVSGEARMTVATPSIVLPGVQILIGAEVAGDPSYALSGLVRAGDLDGDGIDEAIALVPTLGKQSATLIVAAVTTDPRGTFFKITNSVELPPTWVPTGDSDLVAQDIDGDGRKDVVVLCQGRRGRAAFFVLWNDGKGGFDLAQRTTIVPADPEEHVLGMTPIVGGQGLVAPLVAITAKAAYLVKPASANAPRDLSLHVIPGISGGASIAAGDVSADGVPDLVIATGTSVVIHRGIARQP